MALSVLEGSPEFGDSDRWAAELCLTSEMTGGQHVEPLDFGHQAVEGDQQHPEAFTEGDKLFLTTLGGTTFGSNGIAPMVDIRFPRAA